MDFFKKKWTKILFFGLVLFIITEKTMIYTKNLVFLPTVIVFGSFLVPIVFIMFIYENSEKKSIPLESFLYCFLVGGLLGILAAGIVEYEIFRKFNFLPFFAVGLAEEAAKLIFPFYLYLSGRFKSRINGVHFGVVSGMGFAAMETMGYAMRHLIQFQGNINSLMDILLIRGLISPFGHAAWTGYVCFVLWGLKPSVKSLFKIKFLQAFLLVVILHSFWNSAQIASFDVIRIFGFNIISIVIALVSLSLLIFGIKKAKESEQEFKE